MCKQTHGSDCRDHQAHDGEDQAFGAEGAAEDCVAVDHENPCQIIGDLVACDRSAERAPCVHTAAGDQHRQANSDQRYRSTTGEHHQSYRQEDCRCSGEHRDDGEPPGHPAHDRQCAGVEDHNGFERVDRHPLGQIGSYLGDRSDEHESHIGEIRRERFVALRHDVSVALDGEAIEDAVERTGVKQHKCGTLPCTANEGKERHRSDRLVHEAHRYRLLR